MSAVIDGQLNRASDSTRLADRLLSLDMIERRADPNDRRLVLVSLTRKGRDAYRRLTREIQALYKRQWSALNKGELRELRRLLVKALGDQASLENLNALAAEDV